MSDTPLIQLSTRDIPQARRFDFYMDLLERSLWQVSGWDNLGVDFNVDLRGASVGCLTAFTQTVGIHHSHRTLHDVEHSAERACHIFMTTGPSWAFTHLGRHERLDAGDMVIIGEGEHETHAPEGFEGVVVKCPESWLRMWLPDPDLVCGRCIKGDTTWGRVLSLTLRQLSPEFCLTSPVPHSVVVDQIGSLLALVANDAEARQMPELLARTRDCILQRCTESDLTSGAVAATLNVPTRILHRAMTAANTTFANELMNARTEVAWHVLQGYGGAALPLKEVARRAGFSQATHLSRALRRRRAGRVPPQSP